MSLILLVSIFIRILAVCWSLFLLWRLRNWHMGFFSLMLAMMAAHQILTLMTINMDQPVSLINSPYEIPGFVVSLLALPAIFFLNRIFSKYRETQLNLVASERMLQSVLDTIPTRVFWKDRELRYLGCNRHFVKDTKFESASEIIGKDDTQLDWDEPRAFDQDIDRELLNSGNAKRNYEEKYTRPDGSHGWIAMSKVAMIDDEGKINGILSCYEEITLRKLTEEALNVHNRAIGASVNGIIISDAQQPDYPIVYVNPAFEHITGYTADEVLGRNCLFLRGDENEQSEIDEIRTALRKKRTVRTVLRNYRKDGSLFWNELHIAPVRGEEGLVTHFIGIQNDITERKNTEIALERAREMLEQRVKDRTAEFQASEERYRDLFENAHDLIQSVRIDGTIEYTNPAWREAMGYDEDELRRLKLFDILEPENLDHCQKLFARILTGERIDKVEATFVTKDGRNLFVEGSSSCRYENGKAVATRSIFHDVTEQRRLTREITYQASHDALTGLVNRHEFERRIQRVLETLRTTPGEYALCYMDLDQFKIVNDTCGHAAGDELLRQVSNLFDAKIRHRDTLGRLGGDEFGVLLEHCTLEQAQHVADSMRQTLEDFRFVWEGNNFRIGVSIGLVAINETSAGIESLMKAADSACYMAKDSGRNRVHVYQYDDVDLAIRHGKMQWVTRIQNALEDDRFQLNAQSIVPIAKGKTSGLNYELLLRMLDEQGHLILPGEFMPAAEHYQLSVQLDRWVIKRAFSWLAQNPVHLKQLDLCAINLSGLSLGDRKFENFVVQQLEKTGLPGEKICFEITETAAIANLTEATRFIKHLKTYGCKFALDDFGSGLSSFAYLKNFPVDYLKIDGQFVKDILSDPLDLAMVRSINEIGKLMGKQTIAEWVEDEGVFDELQKLGVDYAQGYCVGRPRPLIEMLLAA